MSEVEVEEQPYEMSIVNIIQSIDKLDWTDLEHSPLADIPNNNFYKVEPQQQYLKYYMLFRALLNSQQISSRSYTLTTLMLRLKSTNYYALMLRSKYFFSKQNDIASIEQEIYFANCLLSYNGKEYQIWTYKKQLFTTYSLLVKENMEIYFNQCEFLDYLLDSDMKNYHVWDYKLWLTQYYKKEEQELQSTKIMLFKSNSSVDNIKHQLQSMQMQVQQVNWKNCYSMWSYRFNLKKIIMQNSSAERANQIEHEQIQLMREWFGKQQNLMNECGWNYLTGLVLQTKVSHKQTLTEFLQLSLRIYEVNKKNRFAAAAAIQFCDAIGQNYNEKKRKVISQLLQSDKVRELYYQYLLEN